MSAVITRIKEDQQLLNGVLQNQEPSLSTGIGELLAKSMLIAGARELESELTRILTDFAEEASQGSKLLVEFLKAKAIGRQYYTFFEWKGSNGNSFYALFGKEFKDAMLEHLDSNSELESSIRDFLKLGLLRNQLVHQNFAAYPLDNTLDEIYSIYENAERFCQALPNLLRTLV